MEEINFLNQAIEKARESISQGGFPAGAVVVKGGEVIGEGISVGNKFHDPTSHGEIAAIRNACKNTDTSDLTGAVLYASMEPCSMCHSAAMWSGISKIFFACSKARVSNEYYGGSYKTEELNEQLNKPLELVHFPECEKDSLKVVREWEKSFSE